MADHPLLVLLADRHHRPDRERARAVETVSQCRDGGRRAPWLTPRSAPPDLAVVDLSWSAGGLSWLRVSGGCPTS
jgi:hypothetical protein